MRRRAYPRAASAYLQKNTIILHFEVEFEKMKNKNEESIFLNER